MEGVSLPGVAAGPGLGGCGGGIAVATGCRVLGGALGGERESMFSA